jgi:hypothetical protein
MRFPRFHKKCQAKPEPFEEIVRISKSRLGIEVTIQRHGHVKIRVPEDYAIEA